MTITNVWYWGPPEAAVESTREEASRRYGIGPNPVHVRTVPVPASGKIGVVWASSQKEADASNDQVNGRRKR